MRTVTVSHNWYSFLRCSGIAILTVFGVPSDVSCRDRGRVCQVWSGLVGMKVELGHSLTSGVGLGVRMMGVWGGMALGWVFAVGVVLGFMCIRMVRGMWEWSE